MNKFATKKADLYTQIYIIPKYIIIFFPLPLAHCKVILTDILKMCDYFDGLVQERCNSIANAIHLAMDF